MGSQDALELSLSSVRCCDDLWSSVEPCFNSTRLFASARLLSNTRFGEAERVVPPLGRPWRQRWAQEDEGAEGGHDALAQALALAPRSYLKPARGTEKHDDVEFEHYYVDESSGSGSSGQAQTEGATAPAPAAVAVAYSLPPPARVADQQPASSSFAASSAACSAAAASAAARAVCAQPPAVRRPPDEHKQRTRPNSMVSTPVSSPLLPADEASVPAVVLPPLPPPASQTSPLQSQPQQPSSTPIMLRTRSHQPAVPLKRVAQSPIRVTMLAQFVPKHASDVSTPSPAPAAVAAAATPAASSPAPTSTLPPAAAAQSAPAVGASPVSPADAATAAVASVSLASSSPQPAASPVPAAAGAVPAPAAASDSTASSPTAAFPLAVPAVAPTRSPSPPSASFPAASSATASSGVSPLASPFFRHLMHQFRMYPRQYPSDMSAYMSSVGAALAKDSVPPEVPEALSEALTREYRKFMHYQHVQAQWAAAATAQAAAAIPAAPVVATVVPASAVSSPPAMQATTVTVARSLCFDTPRASSPTAAAAAATARQSFSPEPVMARVLSPTEVASLGADPSASKKAASTAARNNKRSRGASASSAASSPAKAMHDDGEEDAEDGGGDGSDSAPPLANYFILRALDIHFAREQGLIRPPEDALEPSAAYQLDNKLLQHYLQQQAGQQQQQQQKLADETTAPDASAAVARPHLAGEWSHVTGPFASHYTFPVLFDTALHEGRDPLSVPDVVFTLPASLFDWQLRPAPARDIKVGTEDPLTLALRDGSQDPTLVAEHVSPSGDEVSSELWLLRRELLHQVQVNNDTKKSLRAACNAEGAFDREAMQRKIEAAREVERTLASYRHSFPSMLLTEQEMEQAQSVQAAHNAAQRAGKSVSIGGAPKGATPRINLSLLTPEERLEHKRAQRRRNEGKRRARIRAERAALRAAGGGAAAVQPQQHPPPHSHSHSHKNHHHHHHGSDSDDSDIIEVDSDDSDSDAAVPYTVSTPRKRGGYGYHNPATPPRGGGGSGIFASMFARAGKAPRTSNSPSLHGMQMMHGAESPLALSRSRGSGRPAEEVVRACVSEIVAMVEQIDRSHSVVAAKSERVAQLRERREKRQKDMADWEDQRAFTDKCNTVLGAIVAQIECDVAEEAVTAAAAASAAQPMDVDDALPSAACTCGASQGSGQDERKQGGCSCAVSSKAKDVVAPKTSPAAASVPPTRLPAAHFYVEAGYCPREKRPYSQNTPYARCDRCGQWWHTRCMGFLTPEDLVLMYRAYCKPCQELGYDNVPLAQGSRRKRSSKASSSAAAAEFRPSLLPAWSQGGRGGFGGGGGFGFGGGVGVAIADAAVSLHCDGWDDSERLVREEEEEAKKLTFLFQPEKHQQIVLIEEDGTEFTTNERKKTKKAARAPDEDELAVLADPDPWEWLKVKFHRLGSYRLSLRKSAATRRSETKLEMLRPVVVTERFFPWTAEGTKEFRWAKLQQSIPARIRRKIDEREKSYSKQRTIKPRRTPAAAATVSAEVPAAAASAAAGSSAASIGAAAAGSSASVIAARPPPKGPWFPCPDCGVHKGFRTAKALAHHVKYRHTLWGPEGEPIHSAELIDYNTAPKWRSVKQQAAQTARSSSNRPAKRARVKHPSEEGDAEQARSGSEGDGAMSDAAGDDEGEGDILSGDDAASGASVAASSELTASLYPHLPTSPSRVTQGVSRSGRITKRLVLSVTPNPNMRKRQRSTGSAVQSDEEAQANGEADSGQRSRRSSNGKRRKGGRRGNPEKVLPPLPQFPRSDTAFVAVRRAHETSTRFKFTLRLQKQALPLAVLQQITEAKAAATARMEAANAASASAAAASDAASGAAESAPAPLLLRLPRRCPPPSSESDSSYDPEEATLKLSAGCCVCGGMEKPSEVLLCDACDAEVHMYCNVPPLRAVPRGDFFCPPCRQKRKDAALQARAQAKEAKAAATAAAAAAAELEASFAGSFSAAPAADASSTAATAAAAPMSDVAGSAAVAEENDSLVEQAAAAEEAKPDTHATAPASEEEDEDEEEGEEEEAEEDEEDGEEDGEEEDGEDDEAGEGADEDATMEAADAPSATPSSPPALVPVAEMSSNSSSNSSNSSSAHSSDDTASAPAASSNSAAPPPLVLVSAAASTTSASSSSSASSPLAAAEQVHEDVRMRSPSPSQAEPAAKAAPASASKCSSESALASLAPTPSRPSRVAAKAAHHRMHFSLLSDQKQQQAQDGKW